MAFFIFSNRNDTHRFSWYGLFRSHSPQGVARPTCAFSNCGCFWSQWRQVYWAQFWYTHYFHLCFVSRAPFQCRCGRHYSQYASAFWLGRTGYLFPKSCFHRKTNLFASIWCATIKGASSTTSGFGSGWAYRKVQSAHRGAFYPNQRGGYSGVEV